MTLTQEQKHEIGRSIFREANDAFFVVHPTDQRIVSVNPAAQRLTGLRRKQLLELALKDLLEGESSEKLEELLHACQTTGFFAPRGGYYLKSAQGTRRAVHVSASRIHTEPEPLGLIVIRDVTPQKRVEDALRESEGRLRLALEAAHLGTWDWNIAADRVSGSPATCRLLGVEPELFGNTYAAFLGCVVESDREMVQRAMDRTLQTGTPFEVEFRVARLDGVRWLAGLGQLLCDAAGQPERLTGVVQDITERRQIAQRQSEQRLRALIENSSDALAVLDARGTYQYISPSATRILGYAAEEFLGRSALADFHADDLPDLRQIWELLLKTPGQGLAMEGRLRHQDGSWRWIEGVATNRLTDPLVQGVVVNYRDITQRRQLEEQLRQAQKLETVGRLAGGIAHDFNNLLTGVCGYSDLLLQRLRTDDPMREDVEQIRHCGQRAAELTGQLLAFSRKQLLRPTVLDLNQVIASLRTMLGRMLGEHIQLVTDLEPAPCQVWIDRSQIEQVILNLTANARDAMTHGGSLILRTSPVVLEEGRMPAGLGLRPGRHVLLTVSDTGTGMDEATRTHVFEPFFTTKEVGKGTGLGLASVYGVVKQSGGAIGVASDLGRGTTFTIYLPAAEQAPPELVPPPRDPVLPRGRETVLLVEDEEVVRTLCAQVLRQSGYTVLEARHGRDALACSEQHPGPIHLVVTDVVMPGLSGPGMVQRLLVQRPGLQILYITGYPESHLARPEDSQHPTPLLKKPFRLTELAAKVREILDQVAGAASPPLASP